MTNEIQQAPENLENERDQIIRDLSDKAAGVSDEIERLKQEMENYEQQYEMLEVKMHIAEMTREGAGNYLIFLFEEEPRVNHLDFIRAIEAMMKKYALTRSIEKSDEVGREITQDIDELRCAKYFVALLSPVGSNYCWDWGAQQEDYNVQPEYKDFSSRPDYPKDKATTELYDIFCRYFCEYMKRIRSYRAYLLERECDESYYYYKKVKLNH